MSLLVSKKAIRDNFNNVIDIGENNFKDVLWSSLCFARSVDIDGNFTRYYAYKTKDRGFIILCAGANTWGKVDLGALDRFGRSDDIDSYLKEVCNNVK